MPRCDPCMHGGWQRERRKAERGLSPLVRGKETRMDASMGPDCRSGIAKAQAWRVALGLRLDSERRRKAYPLPLKFVSLLCSDQDLSVREPQGSSPQVSAFSYSDFRLGRKNCVQLAARFLRVSTLDAFWRPSGAAIYADSRRGRWFRAQSTCVR